MARHSKTNGVEILARQTSNYHQYMQYKVECPSMIVCRDEGRNKSTQGRRMSPCIYGRLSAFFELEQSRVSPAPHHSNSTTARSVLTLYVRYFLVRQIHFAHSPRRFGWCWRDCVRARLSVKCLRRVEGSALYSSSW